MKNLVKLSVFNFAFAVFLMCLPLLFVRIISGQTAAAPTPKPTLTPKNTESFELSDEFDFRKNPPSAADEAKAKKALDGLNNFLSQLDVKDATDLIAQGYYDAARQKLDAIIKADPKNADALVQRAIAIYYKECLGYYYNQQISDAGKKRLQSAFLDAGVDAENAVKLDPQNVLAYWVLKNINEKTGNVSDRADEIKQKTWKFADQAIAQNPKNAANYYLRGRITTEYGKTTIGDFTKAIALDPKMTDAYYYRGASYSAHEKYYEALADFNKTIEVFPKSINAYAKRGEIYYHLGETAEAVADLRRAIEFDPKNENLALQLKSYSVPVSNWEIARRYKFFKSEFDQSNSVFEQQKKKYNETVAARAQNPVVCAALTELNTAFQNQKSAADKLIFVNNYSQIAELKQAIADNKIIADYIRETSALFAPEAANRGCK